MGPQAKKEYLAAVRPRYLKAGKAEKGAMLDEFCAVYPCHRKHAIRLLVGKSPRPVRRPGPPRRYDGRLLAPLKAIWLAAEQPCGKRLRAALPLWLPAWEKQQALEPELRQKLLAISPATIDRLLRPVRLRLSPKGRCATRPGSLLRSQIPIGGQPWDERRPGFLEADTVAHCGASLAGNFVWSLTLTDIATGWTENRAVWNKGAHGVIEQVRAIEKELPFAILGFDCDNGTEFLNYHLWRYFTERPGPVAFTRCRPYRKNDQAHVEQKNWTHVRQLLGYGRLDRPELVESINELYRIWSLLHNFFCPNLKLIEKRREGSRTIKRYEPPRTPCARILTSMDVSEEVKNRLRGQAEALNPFTLKKQLERRLRLVFDTQRGIEKNAGPPTHPHLSLGNILP